MRRTDRPGWWPYLVAVALFILAAASIVGIFIFALSSSKDQSRFVMPGKGEVEFAEPGDYTIYYEHRSVVGDRSFSTPEQPPNIVCRMTSIEDGKSLPVQPAQFSSRYEMGSRAGVSLYSVHVEQAGTYELIADYAEGQTGDEFVLSVGSGFAEMFLVILASVCGTILFGGIGLVVLIVTFVRRTSAKTKMEEIPIARRC
jgi:hypothetical protein